MANDTFYTPPEITKALGPFDWDLCTDLDAPFRHATYYCYLPERDGLETIIDGYVWCNPPFSKPKPWAMRMARHNNGVLLVLANVTAGWFQEYVLPHALGLFFPSKRWNFYGKDGTVFKGSNGRPAMARDTILVLYGQTAMRMCHGAVESGKLSGTIVPLYHNILGDLCQPNKSRVNQG